MLELLRIQNLALIEDMELELSAGMNVLTGETGAGKSFIVKALDFVTGEKLSTENVRPGKEKASVEAIFIVDNEEFILRRELIAETGRSRFYINDKLSSQETVKELRPSLVLHTSQHGQQKLLQQSFQAKLLDSFISQPHLLEEKQKLLKELSQSIKAQEELEKNIQEVKNKRDLLEFHLHEINAVQPKAGEEEELESLRKQARAASNTGDYISDALGLLQGETNSKGILPLLSSLSRLLEQLGKSHEDFEPYHSRIFDMQDSFYELEKLLNKTQQQISLPVDMEKIEARLYALAQLKRKLHRSLDDILSLQEEISQNLSSLDSYELDKKSIEEEIQERQRALQKLLEQLNNDRKACAENLSKRLEEELIKLGFSTQLRVCFHFSPQVIHPKAPHCIELKAQLLWQPNPGQEAQTLDKIASGGELSRFLLALVTLMSKQKGEKPLLIFDEVDAGVGGLTLNRVAESLEELASSQQLLVISHWPQIAKRAKRHFIIKKVIEENNTFTTCNKLSTEEEINTELARMSGEE